MNRAFTIALAGLLLLASSVSPAADAPVTWTHPTQRVDGTPIALTEIRETQVDWAKCDPGNAFPITAAGSKALAAPAATTTISGLTYGTWCFRARTVDTDGRVSDNSSVTSKQFIAPPKPPVITTVGGLVWEMKLHPVDGPQLARVVGSIAAGKACGGLAPALGFDFFTVARSDVQLTKGASRDATFVAQCEVAG